MILTLQSTTFGAHGGIPTYNRLVCRVLNELEGGPDEKQILVVTDSPKDLDPYRSELPQLVLTSFSERRWAFVLRLMRLVLTRKIDLLLIGHVNYAPLGILLKQFQPSLRYGVMVHGIEVWLRLAWIKRYALRKADFITSVSEYTKQQTVSVNGVDPERVYLLPNALEWEESEVEKLTLSVGWPPTIRLLTVCRFDARERYKGVDTVIKTLPSIVRSFPNVEYFVIGNGPDLERHRELARQLAVADRVHFLGSVDTSTLRSQYEQCDIFVMPSAGEGFGIVFLEAMQYGKPVIAAASGAIPEVVQEGKTGKLVRYGDSEQLAEILKELCSNPHARRRMGTAGYERLQSNFTFRHFKEKLGVILHRELSSTSSNPVACTSPEIGRVER